MKSILFLNANKAKPDYIQKYLEKNNIDIAVFAEAHGIKNKIKGYAYTSEINPKNLYSLYVVSKHPFEIEDINYIIDNPTITKRMNPIYYLERLKVIKLDNIKFIVAHIHAGFYNLLMMDALMNYLDNNYKEIDFVVGDFNSGWLEDNIQVENKGLMFSDGYVFFDKFESKYQLYDLNKNHNLLPNERNYSYKHHSGTLYRIDHCFIKNMNANVSYVDEFLDKKISDHKGIIINLY